MACCWRTPAGQGLQQLELELEQKTAVPKAPGRPGGLPVGAGSPGTAPGSRIVVWERRTSFGSQNDESFVGLQVKFRLAVSRICIG